MSTFTYLIAAVAVAAVLTGRAECRPQTPETQEVESLGGDNQPAGTPDEYVWLGKPGSIVGEVMTYTGSLTVSKQQKKKKQQNGPSASALISGPAEVSFGASAGLSFLPSAAKVEIASAR